MDTHKKAEFISVNIAIVYNEGDSLQSIECAII